MRVLAGFFCLPFIFFAAGPLFGTPPIFKKTREILPVLSYEQAITVGDVNGDGIPDIVAATSQYNPAATQLGIFFGNAKGTYVRGPVIALSSGFEPRGVAIADFNHDGLPDIAVFSGSVVDLFIQQASGSFVAETLSARLENSFVGDIAAADLNHDGLPDLIIPTENGTAVLLNSGVAQFQPPVYVNSIQAHSVALADLNNDGNLDLITVASTSLGGASKLLVQLGEGNGAFYSPSSQPQISGSVEYQIAIADFNLDGNLDVALVTNLAPDPSEVAVLNGNGNGTFNLAYTSPLSLPSFGVAAADINADGKPDLLLVETNSDFYANLLVFENEGLSSFAEPQLYAVQPDAFSLATVTPGPGGHPEVIIVPDAGSFDTVLRSDSNGEFAVLPTYAATDPPYKVLSGDFNGDGNRDLVGFTPSGFVTYLNTGNNKKLFVALPTHPFTSSLSDFVIGDFNGDGRLDIAALEGASAVSAITFLGNGNGTFSNPTSGSSAGPSAYELTAADMNGDGKLDLVTNSLSVALGKGDGTFENAIAGAYSCTSYAAPFIADFNRDGKLDALTSCSVEGDSFEVRLYLGNGDGTFGTSPVYNQLFGTLTGFNFGDFNGDGILDVITINEPYDTRPTLNVMFGVGDGTFSAGPVKSLMPLVVNYPVVADYNGDGVLDVALVDLYDSVVSVLAGNGNGTFQAPQNFGVQIQPAYMLAGPFRSGAKPGDNDLVVGAFNAGASSLTSGFEVLFNTTP